MAGHAGYPLISHPAYGLKVQDIRNVDDVARTIRVIGKGKKERLVPVPDSFGRVLGIALAGKPATEYVFAKEAGGKPMPPPRRPRLPQEAGR